jgi:nucleoside-diphosphate-sugar epimerase
VGGGERFLVTGALGFIGAWTVRRLVSDGATVVAFDLGRDVRRLRSIMAPAEVARVQLVSGDITELSSIEGAITEHSITNVIHLAALQVPFCRADPPLGARVNVLGTINVFEAVKRQAGPMAPIVYTSSIGMFGPDDTDGNTGRLSSRASAHPLNHYGVYKLANEGNARVYWLDDHIPSVGLRPLTVYGVGRDQGMTSGPTKAIVAAVLGLPYRVPFDGPTLFQYGGDVAQALIAASRSGLEGANVFNLDGAVADGPQLLDAIAADVPGARDLISFEPGSLPFPPDIDHDGIEALGPLPVTPFAEGVRASIEIYRGLARENRLVAAEHGLEPQPAQQRR